MGFKLYAHTLNWIEVEGGKSPHIAGNSPRNAPTALRSTHSGGFVGGGNRRRDRRREPGASCINLPMTT